MLKALYGWAGVRVNCDWPQSMIMGKYAHLQSLARFLQYEYVETNISFLLPYKVLWLLLAETGLPALGGGPPAISRRDSFCTTLTREKTEHLPGNNAGIGTILAV